MHRVKGSVNPSSGGNRERHAPGAELLEPRDRFLHRSAHCRIDAGQPLRRDSHADPSDAALEIAGEVLGGARRRPGILGVVAAIAPSISAASSTVRARGPTWSRDQASGKTPRRLTRPSVGLRPTTPHAAAGMRIEPPVSVPTESAHRPAASAAPPPPLEPPGTRSRFQRIATRAEGAHAGGQTVGELVEVLLAETARSRPLRVARSRWRRARSRDRRGSRDPAVQRAPRDVDQVLDSDGNAVERSASRATTDRLSAARAAASARSAGP